jgi:toxin HigB-1
MDIAFKNNHLKELCENSRYAKRELGEACAKKLHARIADIQAAANVTELIAGKPHPLTGKNDYMKYSIQLDGGNRLVFVPDLNPIPRRADGGIDWMLVTRVKVVDIGNYHE